MPISRTNVSPDRAEPQKRTAGYALSSKDSSQIPSKRTLNLCMKEKSGMSAEIFLLVLALILVFVMALEYFGVYRPYTRVEALEADLRNSQAELAEKNAQMQALDQKYKDKYGMTMQEYYNQYNYDGFDLSIADRLDVLEILEREIFDSPEFNNDTVHTRIGSLRISGKSVTFNITGLNKTQLSELHKNLKNKERNPLVSEVFFSYTGYIDDDPTAYAQITLVDASTVQNNSQQGGDRT